MHDHQRQWPRTSPLGEASQPRALDTALRASVLACTLVAAACTETLDAGSSRPHGPLPVDERNPIVLLNDNYSENWQGEYAMLLANGGGPPLAGIIVCTSGPWPNIDANFAGWRNMVTAARDGGLKKIPDPIKSAGAPLNRPASGVIEDTSPNGSDGALLINDLSRQLSLPYRPLVVLTGGRLTDVADAYLNEHSVVDRVVVVAALGGASSDGGGTMGPPNGEMDTWADWIVTSRFRYVQVSAYYDQLTDVPSSRVPELPANAFGQWIAAKQSSIWNDPLAADQIAVMAVAIPEFATDVLRVAPIGPVTAGASTGPTLAKVSGAPGWLVDQGASAVAIERFWQILHDPGTFKP